MRSRISVFPQREELLNLLVSNVNRTFERNLLRMAKNTDSFYTVTMLDDGPEGHFLGAAVPARAP
jgi:hypothetical protein